MIYINSVRSRQWCHLTLFTFFGRLLLDYNLFYDLSTNISFRYLYFNEDGLKSSFSHLSPDYKLFKVQPHRILSEETNHYVNWHYATYWLSCSSWKWSVWTSYFQVTQPSTYLKTIPITSVKLDETRIIKIVGIWAGLQKY